jgi:hypothetical protein
LVSFDSWFQLGISSDQVELDNLVKWLDEGPQVKDKDPENVSLPFKELPFADPPSACTLDKHGLMRG